MSLYQSQGKEAPQTPLSFPDHFSEIYNLLLSCLLITGNENVGAVYLAAWTILTSKKITLINDNEMPSVVSGNFSSHS